MLLKRQKKHVKWIVLIICIIFICLTGENVFEENRFSLKSNWEKLSQDTIDVCDIIVSMDEKPRVIFSDEIYVEIRQYMPKIDMMYGRNTGGFIRGIEGNALDIYYHMLAKERNYDYILSRAIDCAYNFVVVESDRKIHDETLQTYGYKEIGKTENYVVYYNDKVEFE